MGAPQQQQPPQQLTPQQAPAPAPTPSRQRKRPAPSAAPPAVASAAPQAPAAPATAPVPQPVSGAAPPASAVSQAQPPTKTEDAASAPVAPPPAKKSRTNTPWTPAEEQRLKQMRDAGNSWAEIAKVCVFDRAAQPPHLSRPWFTNKLLQSFPSRTEGSVKKHWYKDMHYAEFAEDEVR